MAFANETSPTLIWSEGDQITVFSVVNSNGKPYKGQYHRCSMTSNEYIDTVNAQFNGGNFSQWNSSEVTDTESYYFYGVYTELEPTDFYTDQYGSSVYTVSYTLPDSQAGDLSSQICSASEQAYVNPHTASSPVSFVATTGKTKFTFSPLTALVRLRLKLSDDCTSEEMAISSATIATNTMNAYLAGACSFTLPGKSLLHNSANGSAITVDKEFTLKKGTYTDIYFSTLPTGSDTTITISLTSKDGSTVKLYKDSAENKSFTAKIEGGKRYTVKRDVK
jgi:hypothetical protein